MDALELCILLFLGLVPILSYGFYEIQYRTSNYRFWFLGAWINMGAMYGVYLLIRGLYE